MSGIKYNVALNLGNEVLNTGKSITVKGLSATSVLHITYSPATNTVSVLCGNEQQALASNAVLSAEQIRYCHEGQTVFVP